MEGIVRMQTEQNPGWQSLLVRKGEKLAPTAGNLTTIFLHDLQWAGVFGYDERSRSVALLREPPLPADVILELDGRKYPCRMQVVDPFRIQFAVACAYNVSFRETDVRMGIELAARRKIFDPVRQYLEGLRWDGVERVSKWVETYLGDPASEANAAGRRWLIQAVARVYEPGCTADGILILKGDQGSERSTALQIFGGGWYTDSIGDTRNKDTYMSLLGKWIIELAELDSMKPAKAASFKNFVSNRDDYFREPYAKQSTSHPRRCVFAGTTGDSFTGDAPGGRRFWPVQVTKVDTAALQRDRDQLWAEAVHMYKNKTPWWSAD